MVRARFKKELSLLDLTFICIGSMVGSGWLFAAQACAKLAGPSAILSWLLGAIGITILGLVFAELGSSLPKAGGPIRYPRYTHGPIVSYLMAFATLLSFSSIVAIEAKAVRQYAQAWLPLLGHNSSPSFWGWLLEIFLILIFFIINYRGAHFFGKVNTFWTFIKFIIPVTTILVLFLYLKPSNFTTQGFAPFGIEGIFSAITLGGVVFSFLGFQQGAYFASEIQNPQRNVPLAMLIAILAVTLLYSFLQITFVGALPQEMIEKGWKNLSFSAPFAELTALLGLFWLSFLLYADALISPAGTGNIFMGAAARSVYAWSRTGTFFQFFTEVSLKTGVPRRALILAFLVSIIWTFPFPTWEKLVGVVAVANILTLISAPVSVITLRSLYPEIHQAFRAPFLKILGPIAFAFSVLLVYWSGWEIISWLIMLQILAWIFYLIYFKNQVKSLPFSKQIKSSLYVILTYLGLILISYLGDPAFGGKGIIPTPWDNVILVALSILIYFIGVKTALKRKELEPEIQAEVLGEKS